MEGTHEAASFVDQRGVSGHVDPKRHPDNTFGQVPKKNKVFIRPNKYEPGRANIVVFNWESADEVDVDLGSALPQGASFEIRNAQNFFAKPVAAGVHNGKPVRLPMVLDIARPLGYEDGLTDTERTSKQFNVFVLLSQAGTR